jgi:hypothetical protein
MINKEKYVFVVLRGKIQSNVLFIHEPLIDVNVKIVKITTQIFRGWLRIKQKASDEGPGIMVEGSARFAVPYHCLVMRIKSLQFNDCLCRRSYMWMRLCWVLGGVIVSGQVAAAWVAVGHSPRATVYADPASIRQAGDQVTMLDLYDYRDPQEINELRFKSSVNRHQYNCSNPQRRLLEFTWHSANMGKGAVVLHDVTDREWNVNLPVHYGYKLWEMACSQHASHPGND